MKLANCGMRKKGIPPATKSLSPLESPEKSSKPKSMQQQKARPPHQSKTMNNDDGNDDKVTENYRKRIHLK